MWLSWTIICAVVIVLATYTRRQWPRDIYDVVVYLACGVLVVDYLF